MLSYSAQLVANILTSLGIEFTTKPWGMNSFVDTHVYAVIKGQRLSIGTDPAIAMDAFCETMGATPFDWPHGDPVRHATPDDLVAFLKAI